MVRVRAGQAQRVSQGARAGQVQDEPEADLSNVNTAN